MKRLIAALPILAACGTVRAFKEAVEALKDDAVTRKETTEHVNDLVDLLKEIVTKVGPYLVIAIILTVSLLMWALRERLLRKHGVPVGKRTVK